MPDYFGTLIMTSLDVMSEQCACFLQSISIFVHVASTNKLEKDLAACLLETGVRPASASGANTLGINCANVMFVVRLLSVGR